MFLSKLFFMTLMGIAAISLPPKGRAQEQEYLEDPNAVAVDTPIEQATTEGQAKLNLPMDAFPPRPLAPAETHPPVTEMILRVQRKQPDILMDQIGSVFLTSREETVITEARKGLITRAPTDMEFDEEQDLDGTMSKPTGPREVSLGGVLYVDANDWVVWINSEKITPKNIPSSIIDIRVSKDYIKLKWFDVQTNQIFPIKLRPHQRFNLDTRIFLPG